MRNRFTHTILIILLLLTHGALAGTSIKASLESDTVSNDDNATITVVVEGDADGDPVIPKVQGLDIVLTGRMMSSGGSMSLTINGVQVNRSQSSGTTAQFYYTVVPSDPGEFEIPPFTVTANGNEIKSAPLKLKVTKGGYSQPPRSGGGFPFSQPQPQTMQPDAEDHGDKPFWIATSVSKTNPKVSEEILFHFKLYARSVVTIVDLKMPDFSDFIAESVVEDKKGREVVNGEPYSTYEATYALIPLKAGPVTIGETKMQLRYLVDDQRGGFDPFANDPFFGRGSQSKDTILKAPPVKLTVEALPEPVPENFMHLVGKFSATAEMSEQQIATGETLTYTIKVTGYGNVKDATLPKLEILNAKIYEDKPDAKTSKTENGVAGTKTFKLAIVPSQPGSYTIPKRDLSYFDTETNRYESLTLDAMSFNVTPAAHEETNSVLPQGKNQSSTVPTTSDVAYLDLAPLAADPNLALKPAGFVVSENLFRLIDFGLPLGFFMLLLVTWIRRRGKNPFKAKNLRRAHLQQVLRALHENQASEAQVLEKLRTYFATFTGTPSKALTSVEIEGLCLSHGVPQKTAEQLKLLVERLEASQYGFESAGFSPERRKALETLLREVDNKAA